MTKPEPRLFALKGIRRGGPKKRSKGPKNSWKGSSSPPGAPCPRGPPFTSWVLEMFTTDGATCSVSPAKSGRLTDGEDVAPPPPLGFSAPPKMLIASLRGGQIEACTQNHADGEADQRHRHHGEATRTRSHLPSLMPPRTSSTYRMRRS